MIMSKEEFVNQFKDDMAHKVKRQSTKWTDELVHDLSRLKEEGLSNKEIAERLGVDAAAVGKKIANDKYRGKNADSAAKTAENVAKTAENVAKTAENVAKTAENEAVPVKRDTADSMYISQLEQLLAERTSKCETLEGENQVLQKKLAEQQSIGLDAEKSSQLYDSLGTAAVCFDCISAISPDKLVFPSCLSVLANIGFSAVRESCEIMGENIRNKKECSQTAKAEVGNTKKSSVTV